MTVELVNFRVSLIHWSVTTTIKLISASDFARGPSMSMAKRLAVLKVETALTYFDGWIRFALQAYFKILYGLVDVICH